VCKQESKSGVSEEWKQLITHPEDLERPIVRHQEQDMHDDHGSVTGKNKVTTYHRVVKSHVRKTIENTANQSQELKKERYAHQAQILSHASKRRGQVCRCKGDTIPNYKHVAHREHQYDDPRDGNKAMGADSNTYGTPRERHADR